MSDRVFGIAQLNSYIKSVFEAEELLHNIRIGGEISGFSLGGRNTYFTLKDDDAQIGCVVFGFDGPFPADGDRVILTGTPSYYAKGGRLNFVVGKIEKAGLGDLYLQFLELKKRLRDEGLFDRKIPVPDTIARIGVITSPNGAVIHDIANVAGRRDPGVDVVLYPVRVQGIGAAEEIRGAIQRLDGYRNVDAIILARGGGSAEDLAVYNDERVARAVADCRKFIVSAVGHETDWTLCDECADLRAPTPSAAAELLTQDVAAVRAAFAHRCVRLDRALQAGYLTGARSLARAAERLSYASQAAVAAGEKAATVRALRLESAGQSGYRRQADRLGRAMDRLAWKNPLTVLRQGYARVAGPDPIASVEALSVGQEVRVRLADGAFLAEVLAIEKEQA